MPTSVWNRRLLRHRRLLRWLETRRTLANALIHGPRMLRALELRSVSAVAVPQSRPGIPPRPSPLLPPEARRPLTQPRFAPAPTSGTSTDTEASTHPERFDVSPTVAAYSPLTTSAPALPSADRETDEEDLGDASDAFDRGIGEQLEEPSTSSDFDTGFDVETERSAAEVASLGDANPAVGNDLGAQTENVADDAAETSSVRVRSDGESSAARLPGRPAERVSSSLAPSDASGTDRTSDQRPTVHAGNEQSPTPAPRAVSDRTGQSSITPPLDRLVAGDSPPDSPTRPTSAPISDAIPAAVSPAFPGDVGVPRSPALSEAPTSEPMPAGPPPANIAGPVSASRPRPSVAETAPTFDVQDEQALDTSGLAGQPHPQTVEMASQEVSTAPVGAGGDHAQPSALAEETLAGDPMGEADHLRSEISSPPTADFGDRTPRATTLEVSAGLHEAGETPSSASDAPSASSLVSSPVESALVAQRAIDVAASRAQAPLESSQSPKSSEDESAGTMGSLADASALLSAPDHATRSRGVGPAEDEGEPPTSHNPAEAHSAERQAAFAVPAPDDGGSREIGIASDAMGREVDTVTDAMGRQADHEGLAGTSDARLIAAPLGETMGTDQPPTQLGGLRSQTQRPALDSAETPSHPAGTVDPRASSREPDIGDDSASTLHGGPSEPSAITRVPLMSDARSFDVEGGGSHLSSSEAAGQEKPASATPPEDRAADAVGRRGVEIGATVAPIENVMPIAAPASATGAFAPETGEAIELSIRQSDEPTSATQATPLATAADLPGDRTGASAAMNYSAEPTRAQEGDTERVTGSPLGQPIPRTAWPEPNPEDQPPPTDSGASPLTTPSAAAAPLTSPLRSSMTSPQDRPAVAAAANAVESALFSADAPFVGGPAPFSIDADEPVQTLPLPERQASDPQPTPAASQPEATESAPTSPPAQGAAGPEAPIQASTQPPETPSGSPPFNDKIAEVRRPRYPPPTRAAGPSSGVRPTQDGGDRGQPAMTPGSPVVEAASGVQVEAAGSTLTPAAERSGVDRSAGGKAAPDDGESAESLQGASVLDWYQRLVRATGGRMPADTPTAGVPPSEAELAAPTRAGDSTGARPRANVAPIASAQPPEPLPESTRRFLRPLVGIDPATVSVRRDAGAEQAASALQADAFAVGDVIALGGGNATDTPETLGLLAHELTHVAGSRHPRFVPPVVRGRGSRLGLSPNDEPSTRGETLTEGFVDGEEQQARRVEQRVRAEARRTLESASSIAEPQATGRDRAEALEATTMPVQPGPAVGSSGRRQAQGWDGLPAPWDPLPPWLSAAQADEGEAAAPMDAQSGGADRVATGVSGESAMAGLRRAETGRSDVQEPAAESTQHESQGQPPPDLDALSRQVYDILKRRLAAERRRGT